jgi:hypothetical protein
MNEGGCFMNLATALICLGLAVAFGFVIRYLVKKKGCAGCGEKNVCGTHSSEGCAHCGGHCMEDKKQTKASS